MRNNKLGVSRRGLRWLVSTVIIILTGLFNPFNLYQPPQIRAQGNNLNNIFVKPIKGLEVGLFGTKPDKQLTAVVKENYQVFCANELLNVSAAIGGDYDRYLEINGAQVELNPKLFANIDEGLVMRSGLIHDDQGQPINIDYETYFGNYEITSKVKAAPELFSTLMASYYKQLALTGQCHLAKKSLQNINDHCELLDNPDACPANINVPNTNLTIRQLYSTIQTVECENLSSPEYIKTIEPQILTGLANVPYFQVNTYKPVFLVTAVEQKPTGPLGRLFADWKPHWWNQPFQIKSGDRVEVKVLILPTSGMEENPDEDPLQFQHLSRRFLTGLTEWEAEEATRETEKDTREANAMAALARGFSDSERINCVNCDEGKAQDIYTALASYINAENPSCTQPIRTEKSETIDSQANIDQNLGYNYKTGQSPFMAWINSALNKIFGPLNTHMKVGDVERGAIEAQNTDLETFIIAPYEDRANIYHLLASLPEQQAYATRRQQLPEYLEFNQSSQELLKAEADTHEFFDPDKCQETCEFDENGNPILGTCQTDSGSCMNSFTISIANVKDRPLSHPESADPREDTLSLQSRLYALNHPAQQNRVFEKTENDTELFLSGVKSLYNPMFGSGGPGQGNGVCEEENMTTTLPPKSENEKIVKKIANEAGVSSGLLYGVFNLESGSVIRKQGDTPVTISCGDTINSAGAVGAMSIVQGDCTDRSDLKGLQRDVNACDFEDSIRWAANKLSKDLEIFNNNPYLAACAYYHGAGKVLNEGFSGKCEGGDILTAKEGCEGLTYGECVVDKYGNDY